MSEKSNEVGREQAEVSRLCETGESRIVGRDLKGARSQGTRPSDLRGGKVRPQDRDRRGRWRKKNKARELECGVLGNDDPIASIVGEIIPWKEFYDYDAKYLSEGSEAVIPAKITKAEMKTAQKLAVAAFQAVDCTGLARVDFLMDPKSRKMYVNEINTMPGFTAISMYPKCGRLQEWHTPT